MIMSIEKGFVDIIQSQSPYPQKAVSIETGYRRRLPGDYDYLRLWEALMHPENHCPISAEQRQIIVDKYIAFDNMENTGVGPKASHVTYVKFLCPKTTLPALCAIHQNALETNNSVNLRQASMALIIFNQALDILQPPNPDREKELNTVEMRATYQHTTEGFVYPYPPKHQLSERFAEIRLQAGDGSSNDLNHLQVLMYLAKKTSTELISANLDRSDIKLNPAIPLPRQIKSGGFQKLAELAHDEFLESEQGITFPPFVAKEIKKSEAVFLSVDFNSVMNVDETWANTLLLAHTIEYFNRLSLVFQKTFKGTKQLYVILNTGRPKDFAWGVLQTLSPIKDLNTFGVAEGGRVILADLIKGTMEITLENHSLWKAELDSLQKHLLSKIKKSEKVIIEPKHTVLSISLALPNTLETPEAKWYHQDQNNRPVSPQWINKEIVSYLQEKHIRITNQLSELAYHLEKQPLLQAKVNNIPGMLDDFDDEYFDLLKKDLTAAESSWVFTRRKLRQQLNTITSMQESLEGKYNPTAGFIDISDRTSNKYSALVYAMKKQGINPNNTVTIHVDDSDAGLLTETQSGAGEANENVEKVILVGVANSKGKFLDQVKKRAETGRGLLTYGDATLGLLAVIKGLVRLIDDLKP
jgi:hydroxymethylpyrimidine pyrophosphatase-like HAD family hydrolase